MFPVSYFPLEASSALPTSSFPEDLAASLLSPKTDENKVPSLEEIICIGRGAIQPKERSGASTRRQDRRWVDSSLGLELGFGLRLGSETSRQAGVRVTVQVTDGKELRANQVLGARVGFLF